MAAPGIALFGFGSWGRNLARNFLALGALRAVSDPDPRALEAAQAALPDVHVTTDWDKLLADPALTGCVIATPAASHFDPAQRALDSGKDVFVEKPLALTLGEGETLAELAHLRGRILMVGHLLEYHPAVDRLRELVRT